MTGGHVDDGLVCLARMIIIVASPAGLNQTLDLRGLAQESCWKG
jgi:hypothetical protein